MDIRCTYAFAVDNETLRKMSAHTVLDENQAHISQPIVGKQDIALCGADVATEFSFKGLDHAFANAAGGGRLTCCPVCASIAVAALMIK